MKSFIVLFLVFFGHDVFAEVVLDFKKAAQEIKFLEPREIKELPKDVVLELEKEKCLLPQADGFDHKTSWIKGHFANPKQTDFAVLCSNKKESKIKVVWGGKDQPCPNVLNTGSEESYMQSGSEKIEYSRLLYTISPKEYIKYAKRWKQPVPKDLKQDSIADAFTDKGSTIFLCKKGKWEPLQGSD